MNMTWIKAYSLSNNDLARVDTYNGFVEGRVKIFKNGTVIRLNNGNFKVKNLNHVQVWVKVVR